MENKNYKRNIAIGFIVAFILGGAIIGLMILNFTVDYMEKKVTELKSNDTETVELQEGIEDIKYPEESILISELIEDGYKINLNGNYVTRITKNEGMYDMYAIDDDNKILYVSYERN